MLFEVSYSEEKDLQVYLNGIWSNKFPDYGKNRLEIGTKYFPTEFLENLQHASNEETAKEVVKKYWTVIHSKHFVDGSKLIAKWFSRFLNEEQDQIIKPLEKAYEQPFPFEKITVYLTTFFSCPYDYVKRYFMAFRDDNFWGLLGISRHELNHFMFYYYLANTLKQANYSDIAIETIKEGFSILTSNNPKNENKDKPNVLPVQDFILQNNTLKSKEIIELIISQKLFL